MNITKKQSSFTSTFIPLNSPGDIEKYSQKLNSTFDSKGVRGSVEDMRSQIDYGQAGFAFTQNGVIVVGKDKSSDMFIFNIIKSINDKAKYTDDAPEVKSGTGDIKFFEIG